MVCAYRFTTTRKPSCRSNLEWLSKWARASAALVTATSTTLSLPITIGRLENVWGQIGTSAIADNDGCMIGPPEDNAYAVEPVGVATIKPSARNAYRNL